jgi:hypothetical protein
MYFFSELTMFWNEKTCAKVLYFDKIKSSTGVIYEYEVEGKKNNKSNEYSLF